MKNAKFYLLCCLILIGCNSPQVGQYFRRPVFEQTVANVGSGYRNGELVDITNNICVSTDELKQLESYYNDKEFRLYVCLKYPRKCR